MADDELGTVVAIRKAEQQFFSYLLFSGDAWKNFQASFFKRKPPETGGQK